MEKAVTLSRSQSVPGAPGKEKKQSKKDLEKQVAELKERNKAVERDFKAQVVEKRALKGQVEMRDDLCTRLYKEIEKQKTMITRLSQNLEDVKKLQADELYRRSQVGQELYRITQKNQTVETQLGLCANKCKCLREENENLKTIVYGLSEENKELTATNKRLVTAVNKGKEKEEENERCNYEKQNLITSLLESQDRNIKQEDIKNKLKERIEELENELQIVTEKCNKINTKLSRTTYNQAFVTCENVQLGASSNIVSNSLEQVEEKIDQMSSLLKALITDKTKTEKEKMEMRETLPKMMEMFQKFADSEAIGKEISEQLAEMQEVIECWVNSGSDKWLIQKGINRYRQNQAKNKFSPLIEAALGGLEKRLKEARVGDLVEIFELSVECVQLCVCTKDGICIDRQACEKMLKHWLKRNDENDESKLYDRLAVFQEKRMKEIVPCDIFPSQESNGFFDSDTRDQHILSMSEWMIGIDKKVDSMMLKHRKSYV